MASAKDVPSMNSISPDHVLGMGRTSCRQVPAQMEHKHREQRIYRRLEGCRGIVPVLEYSAIYTRLRLMEHGDLRAYLTRHKTARSMQLRWFQDMARIIAQVHDRRVLVADIATRKFILDAELTIALCDFSESIALPRETDMQTTTGHGWTMHIDSGMLDAVFYEVIVGVKCEFDI
ncbi:hypothetical protein BJX64DRAFT_269179 [Aspergillus heterothallicus]